MRHFYPRDNNRRDASSFFTKAATTELGGRYTTYTIVPQSSLMNSASRSLTLTQAVDRTRKSISFLTKTATPPPREVVFRERDDILYPAICLLSLFFNQVSLRAITLKRELRRHVRATKLFNFFRRLRTLQGNTESVCLPFNDSFNLQVV